MNFQKATGAAFYQVSWECDGNYKIINEAKYTHDYQKTGTFNVCIRSGSPLAFYAPGLTTEEKAKLLKIKQWGYIKWSSFESAFYGMRNMQLTASDAPNLSAVTNMSGAFSGLANFTGNEYMNTWNTINVTDMSNMFLNSPKFNAPIGNWKTDNVENILINPEGVGTLLVCSERIICFGMPPSLIMAKNQEKVVAPLTGILAV